MLGGFFARLPALTFEVELERRPDPEAPAQAVAPVATATGVVSAGWLTLCTVTARALVGGGLGDGVERHLEPLVSQR